MPRVICAAIDLFAVSLRADDAHAPLSIIEQARGNVARSVNFAMVQACWHIGREIVEVEQEGEAVQDAGKSCWTTKRRVIYDGKGEGEDVDEAIREISENRHRRES